MGREAGELGKHQLQVRKAAVVDGLGGGLQEEQDGLQVFPRGGGAGEGGVECF